MQAKPNPKYIRCYRYWLAQWERISFMIQQSEFDSARSQDFKQIGGRYFALVATKTCSLNFSKIFHSLCLRLTDHTIYWIKYEADFHSTR